MNNIKEEFNEEYEEIEEEENFKDFSNVEFIEHLQELLDRIHDGLNNNNGRLDDDVLTKLFHNFNIIYSYYKLNLFPVYLEFQLYFHYFNLVLLITKYIRYFDMRDATFLHL